MENSITIEEKLAEFRVKVNVVDAYAGPVITRYEIEPDVGVRGNSVINLEKDLARSLGVAAIRNKYPFFVEISILRNICEKIYIMITITKIWSYNTYKIYKLEVY